MEIRIGLNSDSLASVPELLITFLSCCSGNLHTHPQGNCSRDQGTWHLPETPSLNHENAFGWYGFVWHTQKPEFWELLGKHLCCQSVWWKEHRSGSQQTGFNLRSATVLVYIIFCCCCKEKKQLFQNFPNEEGRYKKWAVLIEHPRVDPRDGPWIWPCIHSVPFSLGWE